MLVGRLIDLIVAFGLEEEMSRLPTRHRHAPGQQGGIGRVHEQERVRRDKAQRAQEMEALVDSAMMVVAMIVPAQDRERFKKLFHVVTIKKNDLRVFGHS